VLRLVLLIAGVALTVHAALALGDHRRCTRATTAINGALFHDREPAGGLAEQQRRLERSCSDPAVLAGVSTVMTTAGRAAPGLALARRATHDAPDLFVAWVALTQALERRDPAGARTARAHALRLNPLGRVPPAAGAGAARQAP